MSETEHEDQPVSPETVVDEDEQNGNGDENGDESPEETPAEASAETPDRRAAPKSEKEIERALKTVEKAGTTYRNAVSRAMGEDAQDLEPCPRCNAPVAGLIFKPSLASVDDAVREAVLASIGAGAAAGPPLQPAKGVETCPTCRGNGQLEYPTFVEHTRVQPCVKCQGVGYVTEEAPAPAWTVADMTYTNPTTAPANTWQNGANDQWGRPVGHPHYGQNPATVGV